MHSSARTVDIIKVGITHKTAHVQLLEAVSFKDKANAHAEMARYTVYRNQCFSKHVFRKPKIVNSSLDKSGSWMREKKAKIARLSLLITALVSIGLGFLKIYTHYYSIWRSGPLDYSIALGAIVGGLMVFVPKSSKVIFMVCIAFLTFEVFKAIIDFLDYRDVLICAIAIICLIIPVIRYSSKQKDSWSQFWRDFLEYLFRPLFFTHLKDRKITRKNDRIIF